MPLPEHETLSSQEFNLGLRGRHFPITERSPRTPEPTASAEDAVRTMVNSGDSGTRVNMAATHDTSIRLSDASSCSLMKTSRM
jgi:hypothetical protein